jgi:hypothetical protein
MSLDTDSHVRWDVISTLASPPLTLTSHSLLPLRAQRAPAGTTKNERTENNALFSTSSKKTEHRSHKWLALLLPTEEIEVQRLNVAIASVGSVLTSVRYLKSSITPPSAHNTKSIDSCHHTRSLF